MLDGKTVFSDNAVKEKGFSFRKDVFFKTGCLMKVLHHFQLKKEESFFWQTHAGAGLSLFFVKDGKRTGFDFQEIWEPKITRSMKSAVNDLKLDHLYILFPGRLTFSLAENITAQSLSGLPSMVL